MSIISQIETLISQQEAIELQKQDLKCQSFSIIDPFSITIKGLPVNITGISNDGGGIITINFTNNGVADIARIKNPPILVDDPLGTISKSFVDHEGVTQTRTFREDPKQIVIDHLNSIL